MLNNKNILKSPAFGAFDNSFKVVSNVGTPGIYLIGFGFDGTACFRKGTKEGPDAIRDVSDGIETYSPYLDADLSDNTSLFDLGNLVIGSSHDQNLNWQIGTDNFNKLFKDKNLINQNIKIISLGGEHSVSYAPIKTYLDNYEDLIILHLDAHADLRDGYQGFHYSHASIMRRVLDHFKTSHQLIQYGIRSGTKEEYLWMSQNNTLKRSLEELTSSLKSIPADRPIYLTLDLDFFDPAYLPGTGTPEAGGENFHSFIKIIKILKTKNLVGSDIVELSPPIDKTGNSNVFAAKVLREVILAME